jgi:pyruvate formate lyase activating enzyme
MIHAWLKTSLIDYPGKVASVIFLSGCNLACSYCHNAALIKKNSCEETEWNDIFIQLLKRKRHIDAVVISGGEPTLDQTLSKKVIELKEAGFFVKLDTNGAKPELVKELLDASLLDYIALDIKGLAKTYQSILGGDVSDYNKAIKTLQIINQANIPYEVRTTIIKAEHSKQDLLSMFGEADIVEKWALQQYQYSIHNYKDIRFETYSLHEMSQIRREILNSKIAQKVELRGLY